MSATIHSKEMLDFIFGSEGGATPRDRARRSKRMYVRGIDLLAEESPTATGRKMTASEAFDAYGIEKLLEVQENGLAVISESVSAAGDALRARRVQLGLTTRHVATAAKLEEDEIKALEASKRRKVQDYEKVARVLGLDERKLSFVSDPTENQGVVVRLRTLKTSVPKLSASVVARLSEAAWVAMTQIRLERDLNLPTKQIEFKKNPNYGTNAAPAFKVGYFLAGQVRMKLGYGDAPIPSMRDLLERRLRIPVIQADLGANIAGATIAVGERRAIILNLSGLNRGVFARRNTAAHELCHILFDPNDRLMDLRVDEYKLIERRVELVTDPIEQRANAFAVELLAPRSVALQRYQENSETALARLIETYGISYTAAKYQLWNAMGHEIPLEDLARVENAREQDWEGPEAYTSTWHPINSLPTMYPTRAGRFSALAIRSAAAGIVSWDTAGQWLGADPSTLNQVKIVEQMTELYPD